MSVFSGFSKLSRKQRISYVIGHSSLDEAGGRIFDDYLAREIHQQQLLQEMIENYVGNFPLPMGVVSNMLINGEMLVVPFVTEESSVVAAASKAAKFWASRGGFEAIVGSMTKKGQVHFTWNGEKEKLNSFFPSLRSEFFAATAPDTEKMRKRGGGITAINLLDKTSEMVNYFQIDVSFETADAMGANFINSCLERIASVLEHKAELNSADARIEVIISVLTNYTPDCKVSCKVECPIVELSGWNKVLNGSDFATKFKKAVDIAQIDLPRAVTHNKGIFNGVDAVLLATGNDLRATSAAAHAYASRSGSYKGLSGVSLTDGIFQFKLEMPLALGIVGGVTQIHPMVKNSLAMMNHPDARELMKIVAAAGLASNFSAIASLISTGIQEGHMRLHLSNILNQFQATNAERDFILGQMDGVTVSFATVEKLIGQLRGTHA
jgi:hydroxymethylglutaryl-CoA reductase